MFRAHIVFGKQWSKLQFVFQRWHIDQMSMMTLTICACRKLYLKVSQKCRSNFLITAWSITLVSLPLNSYSAPDAAIRISKRTIESLIVSMVSSEVAMIDTLQSSFSVASASVNLDGNPASVKLMGSMTKNERTIPVTVDISVSIGVGAGVLELATEVMSIKPQYEDIPLSDPVTLFQAWFLSNLGVSPGAIDTALIPFQPKIKIPNYNSAIRFSGTIGSSTADIVAQISLSGQEISMSAESVNITNNAIWIALSEAGTASEEFTDSPAFDDLTDTDGLFLDGNYLSNILNRSAGFLEVPFHIVNSTGKVAGESSSTIFGRKEWYVKFHGDRPLEGELQFQNSFKWVNQLQFSSRVSLSAHGQIHGHGDPGPGGGCGVRPHIQLIGEAAIDSILIASLQDNYVEVSVDTTDSSSARVTYNVERTNFCGIMSKGPFRGIVDMEIPADLGGRLNSLNSTITDISDKYAIESTAINVAPIHSGYWIKYRHNIVKTD